MKSATIGLGSVLLFFEGVFILEWEYLKFCYYIEIIIFMRLIQFCYAIITAPLIQYLHDHNFW